MNKSISIFNKVSLIAAILALCLVVLGAYVRLSDAGLGCPDWPGCYGTLTVPQSEEAIQHAQTSFPHVAIESGKAWKEMVHRYFAGTLVLLVLSLFVLAWINKAYTKSSPWLTSALLGVIAFQAMLGMWTVTLLLKPVVVSAHLLGGIFTLAILVWIAHRQWGVYPSKKISLDFNNRLMPPASLRFFIRFSFVILFAQIFLGGWTSTNYAALACTDFPTCHGAWVPATDYKNAFHLVRELGRTANGDLLSLQALSTIQWTHRIGALITLIYLGILSIFVLRYQVIRNMGFVLLILLLVQISLGIANLVLYLPLVLAVAHNLGAALLMVAVVVLNSKITLSRISSSTDNQSKITSQTMAA
ncbi:MAG: COX15/CtaA family protein [Methylophilaceae bacterium]|nr:COX15/CtaA family protein [Methylophilaceae bacterium]